MLLSALAFQGALRARTSEACVGIGLVSKAKHVSHRLHLLSVMGVLGAPNPAGVPGDGVAGAVLMKRPCRVEGMDPRLPGVTPNPELPNPLNPKPPQTLNLPKPSTPKP